MFDAGIVAVFIVLAFTAGVGLGAWAISRDPDA